MSKQWIKLSVLRPGENGILRQTEMPAAQQLRMEELGLLPGAMIRCLYRAPHGTPAAYLIGDAVFALRRKDAERIRVETVR